jgi:hypothetical protein
MREAYSYLGAGCTSSSALLLQSDTPSNAIERTFTSANIHALVEACVPIFESKDGEPFSSFEEAFLLAAEQVELEHDFDSEIRDERERERQKLATEMQERIAKMRARQQEQIEKRMKELAEEAKKININN